MQSQVLTKVRSIVVTSARRINNPNHRFTHNTYSVIRVGKNLPNRLRAISSPVIQPLSSPDKKSSIMHVAPKIHYVNIGAEENSIPKAFSLIDVGDLRTLKNMIESNKIDVNQVNEKGNTLLQNAIKKFDVGMVELLLASGADPNKVSAEDSVFTIQSNRKIIGEQLKLEISGLTPLMTALNESTENVDDKVGNKSDKDEARKQIVSLLLIYNADPNIALSKTKLTPAHFAANYCQVDNLKQILVFGANPNAIAFEELKQKVPERDISNVNPLLLAVNKTLKYESGKCIETLMESGASIDFNRNIVADFTAINNALSVVNPSLAEQNLLESLDKQHQKIDYKVLMEKINDFIKKVPNRNDKVDEFIQDILGTSISYDTHLGSGKYYAHLNSWDGILTYKFRDEYKHESAFAWDIEAQIPKKIKNLLMVLKKIENSRIDCIENFGETRASVVEKIKNEIWAQSTNYLTAQHTLLLNKSFINKVSKEERQAQLSSDSPSSVQRMDKFYYKEAANWVSKIRELKPGQSFSIASGGSNHAIYLEFKKQENGDYTRYIYNLGAGKNLHIASNDDKIYTYIVKDIPKDVFEKDSKNGIKYFSNVMMAKSMIWLDLTQNLIYDYSLLKGKIMDNVENLTSEKAMKYQITGNCSVKNNLAGVKNRLKNDKLYESIKNYEKQKLSETIKIPSKLHQEKEILHDLSTIKFMNQRLEKQPEILEKKLYAFLSKRSGIISGIAMSTSGKRIVELINRMDKNLLKAYSTLDESFTQALDTVSQYCKNPELTKISNQFKQMYSENKELIELLTSDIRGTEFQSLNMISKDVPKLESKLFSILNNRLDNKIPSIEKEGARITSVIKQLGNNIMDFYIAKEPLMIKFLDLIAKHYNQPDLKKIVDGYDKNVLITVKPRI